MFFPIKRRNIKLTGISLLGIGICLCASSSSSGTRACAKPPAPSADGCPSRKRVNSADRVISNWAVVPASVGGDGSSLVVFVVVIGIGIEGGRWAGGEIGEACCCCCCSSSPKYLCLWGEIAEDGALNWRQYK